MDKQEFLNRLRASLSGKIAPAQLEDTMNYYEDYINIEIRKGKSEEQVLQELGDPRLIARTIVETSGGDNSVPGQGYSDAWEEQTKYKKVRHIRLPGWLLTLLIIVVIFLIFSLIFSVLSFLAPVILIILAVLFLVKLFRDWLN